MIIILGRAPLDLIQYIKENNLHYIICVTTQHEQKKMQDIDIATFLVNINSKEELRESLHNIHVTQPTAVVTFFERYVIARAWIGELYDIPSISEKSAHAATDKILMRAAFEKHDPSITPAFKIINSLDDAIDFAQLYGYPFMIKPSNLQKSLLVTKIRSETELRKQYTFIVKTVRSVYAKESRTQEPRLLAEEFLDGTLHSIQTFTNKSGAVTCFGYPIDLFTAKMRGIDDTHLFARISPTELSPKKIELLKTVAIKATQALELTNTPGHVEMIYTKNGPKVIEVGPRIGGYRTRIYEISQNLNLNAALIANASNIDILHTKISHIPTAVIELFPHTEGFFDRITNLNNVLKLSSYYYHDIKRITSDRIGLAKNSYRATCVIIIKNHDHQVFMQDFDYINKNVHVIIK